MNILKPFQPSNRDQKFYTFEGDVYRNDNSQLVRKGVAKHYRQIDSINKLKSSLRAGEYTFPGCYRLFFITNDGCALSYEAVLSNLQGIYYSMMHDFNDGWNIIGMSSTAEFDDKVFCHDTGKEIC